MRFAFSALAPALALLFLSLVSTSVRAQCDTAPTTTQACDDGDPCTTNDTETILDADGSTCLPCAGILIAACTQTSVQACDDGDPCTENDMETVDNCDGSICIPCAGTPSDCTSGTITITACDDGNPSTENDMATILDCDGSVCVPCAGTVVTCDTGETTTQPCDDGDRCTGNDMETILNADGSICIPCAGTPLDCATGPTLTLACNDGNPLTFDDEVTILLCDGSVVCVPCAGTISTCDNSATTTRPCNDRDPCTENDAATTLDADGSVCTPCAGTPIIYDCASGPTTTLPCDDGNPATINDIQTILDCAGTICMPCAGALPTPCDDPLALIDLEANAVRARLTTNGSLWNGTYAVTDGEDSPNVNPVNAIRTGALWIGGLDPAGGLFVRAPLDATGPGNYGYQPGPLIGGQTDLNTCANWDRFFTATAEEVRHHHEIYWAAIDSNNNDLPIPIDQIPASILGWPGAENPHFEAQTGFPLHDSPNGLAPFWDEDLNGVYDPTLGDHPLFCGAQGIWSVFNTETTIFDNTTGQYPLQIDVMASAPESANPDLQRTTFYTYTIKSSAPEGLINAYVGHFIDSDLGCADNDRTGSDPEAGLFYVYNEEATEGACPGGEAGYTESNPVNVFQVVKSRFPENFEGVSLYGIQSHLTFYSEADGNFPAGTHAPNTPEEAYNYLQGRWRDGSSLFRGGNGYDQAGQEETRFSFDGVETDGAPWLSCTSGVPATDIGSIYGIGPFDLRPGGIVQFTLAVTTLFDVDYTDGNCPDREAIRERAQAVRLHFEDGCPREIDTAIDPESAADIGLEVFPNPASDLLTFRLPETERAERLELIDLTGRVVVSVARAGRDFTLDVAGYGLKAGTYFYRLYTASERLVSGKVVVR